MKVLIDCEFAEIVSQNVVTVGALWRQSCIFGAQLFVRRKQSKRHVHVSAEDIGWNVRVMSENRLIKRL